MLRKIVKIDEEKCNGCGDCIPSCHEGALQIIDGKARLISDLFCDGLGACLGYCPEGALTVVEAEARPYDENAVMEIIVKQGSATILAHLKHLKEHGEHEYFNQAVEYMKENNIKLQLPVAERETVDSSHSGCPGSRTMNIQREESIDDYTSGLQPSALRQWPVQLHLINPQASYFKNADLLVAADCTAFAMGNFHSDYLRGKTLVIACPKLDTNQEIYLNKLVSLIEDAGIKSITVMIMEVPCCGGLYRLAMQASQNAVREIPVKIIVVGVNGEVLKEEFVSA